MTTLCGAPWKSSQDGHQPSVKNDLLPTLFFLPLRESAVQGSRPQAHHTPQGYEDNTLPAHIPNIGTYRDVTWASDCCGSSPGDSRFGIHWAGE